LSRDTHGIREFNAFDRVTTRVVRLYYERDAYKVVKTIGSSSNEQEILKFVYLGKQEIERSMVTDHNCIETLLYTFKTLKFENKMLHKKLGEKDVL
jgi:hypothetical protein